MIFTAQTCWRTLKTAFGIFCLAGAVALLGVTQDAWAKVSFARFSRLAPDQTDVGFAEIYKKADEWIADAEWIAKTNKTAVKKEAIKIIDQNLNRAVPADISPDGLIRPADSHHKLFAALRVMEKLEIPKDKVKFSMDVQLDGSKYGDTKEGWERYAKKKDKERPASFSKEVLNESEQQHETLGERYKRRLPTSFSFSTIHDSPIRSAMGGLFDSLGLIGSDFEDSIQFTLGDAQAEHGLTVESGQENSPGTLAKIQELMFRSDDSEKFQRILIEGARKKGKQGEIKAALDKAKVVVDAWASKTGGRLASPIYTGEVSCGGKFAELPVTVPMFEEQGASARMLLVALKKFNEGVDQRRLGGLLEKLSDGKKSLDGSDVKFLKEARKTSLIYRSAAKLMSESKAPPEYREFVTGFGELNDWIRKWGFKGKPSKEMTELAGKLKKLLKNENVSKLVEADTWDDFKKSNANLLNWMAARLDAKDLTVGEYHDMRKAVRDYMNFFDLMTEESPTAEYFQVKALLGSLSHKMGIFKDGVLSPTKDPKAMKDKLKAPTQVDPDSKEDIYRFLNLMKSSLDIS